MTKEQRIISLQKQLTIARRALEAIQNGNSYSEACRTADDALEAMHNAAMGKTHEVKS